MSDDKDDGDSKIIKGPWLGDDEISEDVIKEIDRIIEQEKLDKAKRQKPIEEKITVALIEYFQAANNRKQQLKAMADLNNSKASMIEGLRLENRKLKEIIPLLEKERDKLSKEVKELRRDNKILSEDNAKKRT